MELIDKIKLLKAGQLEFKELTQEEVDEAFEKGYLRIRKLTPRECFRLMDVKDGDIDTIQKAGLSASSQYKLAGNSIVCACLVGIYRKLFQDIEPDPSEGLLF